MRKWVIRLIVIVVAAAGMWALRVAFFRPSPVEVTVVPVSRGHVEATITNSKAGTVQARRRGESQYDRPDDVVQPRTKTAAGDDAAP